jgi:protein-S-isoprenylcysteine O-methyltransferase Ste14
MIRTHLLLTLVAGIGVIALIREFRPPVWGVTQVLGMGLLLVGFVCWTIAHFQLGSSFTATAQARHLVTHGLYSKIRNPIYVFGLCMIAGIIFAVGKLVWLLILVVIIPLQIRRAKKESAVLQAAFGEEYRKYRAGTWF